MPPRTSQVQPPKDPFADAVFIDNQGVAENLSEILDTLREFDSSSVYGVLHRKPDIGIGSWEYIQHVEPPINMDEIMSLLKSMWPGGGRYRLAIFADKKTRKQIEFAVAGDPSKAPTLVNGKPVTGQANDFNSMMMMMMQMQESSRREAGENQRFFAQQQDAAAARNTALIGQIIAGAMPALIPILAGANREKLSDIIAMMREGKGGGTKETLELMAAMKTLIGDGGGAKWDPADLVGSIAAAAGPAMAGLSRAIGGNRAAPGQGEGATDDQGQLYLEGPPPGAPAPVRAALPAAAPVTGPDPAAPGGDLLSTIRPDILYFFHRGHDPELSAEAVADIMLRGEVDEAEINGLVAALRVTPNWKDILAAQGLDLRSNPEWADAFLEHLIAAWTDSDRDSESGAGGDGGLANLGGDAELRASGVAVDDGKGPGAPAH